MLSFPACASSAGDVPVVKIGLVAPFEGSYRYIGYDAVYAARLAIREINEGQDPGEWHLELVAYDDRASSDMAAQIARNLVADPAVVAVIGHYRPETTSAASEVYAAAQLPFITLGAWTAPAPTTWQLMPPADVLTRTMLEAVGARHDDVLAVWGRGLAGSAAELAGPSSADHEAAQVLTFLPPVAAGETLSAWRREGWTGQIVGALDLASSTFATVAGAAALGATFVTPYPFPRDVADIAGWVADYRAMGPHVPEPGPYALPTYEAVHLVAGALRAAVGAPAIRARQTVARDAVGAALDEVTRTGWLGEISWDEQHAWRDAPLYTYRWTAQGAELIGTHGTGTTPETDRAAGTGHAAPSE